MIQVVKDMPFYSFSSCNLRQHNMEETHDPWVYVNQAKEHRLLS